MLSHLRAFTTLLISLSVILLFGCEIDEQKLEKWSVDAQGQAKLAAYALEFERPPTLRQTAIKELYLKRRYNLMLTMFEQVGELKIDRDARLKQLASDFAKVIDEALKVDSITPEEESRVAEIGYYLLTVNAARDVIAQEHVDLLKSLTSWSLNHLREANRKVISPVQGKDALVDPSKLLRAILLTSESDQALMGELFEVIKKDMSAHLDKVDYALRLHKVIDPLKNKTLSAGFAELWMQVLTLAHREQPKAITPEVLAAVRENGNITLVRLLIDLGRDQESVADPKALSSEIRQALDQARTSPHLKSLRDNILRVISSERAATRLIFDGLYWAWTLGDQSDLKALLMSLPKEFKVPVLGRELRENVDQVCADLSSADRDVLYEQLEDTLVSLKSKREHWLARLITVACLDQLYPDGATVKTLIKKHRLYKSYRRDSREILAWETDRQVTLGEIVTRYIDEE